MEQTGEHEWELSKENVQPLRQGRKFSSLSAALQPHSSDHLAKLREERQLFETEIRMYQGEDPLSTWDKYITWTEQNFPKGGKESNMQELLERCVTLFKDEEKYKNDSRYLNAWLKFANICNDPLEIFNFLFMQGVGTKLATLYQTWAWHLEQFGNSKKADEIFSRGLENGAQPLEDLQLSHREFQARVIRQTAGNVADGMPAQENFQQEQEEKQRAALGELKGRGKKAAVPSNRAGALKQSRGLSVGATKPVNNGRSQGFQVFCDENAGTSGASASAPANDLVAPFSSNKDAENVRKAGKWSNAKVKQRNMPNVPVSEVAHVATPSFAVHEDENADQPMQTPRKGIPQMNPVLSEKKQKKHADPFYQFTHVQNEQGLVPMYCKQKIYAGTQEFSFEELRSAQWKQKATRRQIEAERQAIEKQKEELRRKEEEMKRMQEQIRQQAQAEVEEILARERRQIEEKMRSELQKQQAMNTVPAIKVETTQTPVAMNTVPTAAPQPPVKPALSMDTEKQVHKPVMFPNRSKVGLSTSNKSITPNSGIFNNTATKTSSLLSNTTSSGGRNLPNFTPDSSIMGSQVSCNRSSLTQTPRGIAAPSPTVNTKFAMQNVLGMFDQTLDAEKQFGWGNRNAEDDDFEDEFAVQEAKPAPAISGGMPFTIFEEEPPAKKSLTEVMEEDPSNKENTPPKGYQQVAKRQGVTNILMPTRGATASAEMDHDKENRVSPVMHLNMEDECEEDEEVISAPVAVRDWVEKMDTGDLDDNFDEMTFTPGYCSTKNFTEAARLASTPFNAAGDMAPLPEPPVSTIKNVGNREAVNSNQTSLCDSKSSNVTTDSTAEMKTRRSSMFTGKQEGIHDLSPIMEQSEDSVKSTASSTSSGAGGDHPGFMSTHQPHPLEPITEQTESRLSTGSSSEKSVHSNKSLGGDAGNMTCHEIDITNYIPPDLEEKTEALLNRSIAIDPRDPFDENLIRRLVSKLKRPISSYPNYQQFEDQMPEIVPNCPVKLGDNVYDVNCHLAEGGFANVYRAEQINLTGMETDENIVKVLKVQKPACPWEFYAVSELHDRLYKLNTRVDVRSSIMSVDRGYFYNDGSCLVNDMLQKGTLLTMVNLAKQTSFKKVIPESVAIYLTIQLLHIVENIHKCNMIHGDLKPDNLMLLPFPTNCNSLDEYLSRETKCLKLIDFGRTIDMQLFPEGTTFLSKITTSGFQCIEMKTDQPWTYQTDYFGLLGTIHVMLFGNYMNVFMKNGKWGITNTIKRYMMACHVWKKMFDEMLNIPSCDELPSLTTYRQELETVFRGQVKLPEFSKHMAELNQQL